MKTKNIVTCVLSILTALILITHLSSCQKSQPEVPPPPLPPVVETQDYTLFFTEEGSYIELNKELFDPPLPNFGLIDYHLYFSSVNEMREKMLQGELTERQLANLHLFSQFFETGRVKLPDFNKLYDLDLKYGSITRVGMLGDKYSFSILMDCGANGSVRTLSETDFAEILEEKYASSTESPSNAISIERRTVRKRNAEEIIWTKEGRKIEKCLIYSVTNQFGTYTIFEDYRLDKEDPECSETVPYKCKIFLKADNGYYVEISLGSFEERPSVKELTSMTIKAFSLPAENSDTE